MTDNEIIKALECCASSTHSDACVFCPFNELKICEVESNGLEKRALDLINRQKAEIERLTVELADMRSAVQKMVKPY